MLCKQHDCVGVDVLRSIDKLYINLLNIKSAFCTVHAAWCHNNQYTFYGNLIFHFQGRRRRTEFFAPSLPPPHQLAIV